MEHHMMQTLFGSVLPLGQNTPYKATLSIVDDLSIVIDGDAIVKLERDKLRFEFYAEMTYVLAELDYYELIAKSQKSERSINLSIPDREFVCDVDSPISQEGVTFWNDRPIDRLKLTGTVASRHLGSANEAVTRAVALFKGIPKFHLGKLGYFFLTTNTNVMVEGISDQDRSRVGVQRLDSFNLRSQEWVVDFQEVPAVAHIGEYGETHEAGIHKLNRKEFNGSELREFLDDLSLFLGFVFGMPTRPSLSIARNDNATAVWGSIASPGPKAESINNWFAGFRDEDQLSDLFASYMKLIEAQPLLRKYWHKLIAAYLDSQTAFDQLGNLPAALIVSMSALEGIVKLWLRLEIFDHQRREFVNTRSGQRIGQIKPGRLEKAIKCVLDRIIPGKKPMMDGKNALKLIIEQRNLITHIDLDEEFDGLAIYRCWNASQALFELLLLSMLGMKEIPSRTAAGKKEVMGEDMLKEARRGELTFE